MNRPPNRNTRPPQNARPAQSGNRQNRSRAGVPNRNGYGYPRGNMSGNPYQNGYENPNMNRPQGQPPPYGNRPSPDPEYLRRKRELDRRQAEARRQAARDRERRENQRRKAERERRFRHNMKIFGGRLLVFAIVLVILSALTALLFMLYFRHTPDKPDTSGDVTYYYGGSKTRKSPTDEVSVDGETYICFNDLAEYLGMMESGSAEAMKFILPDPDVEVPSDSGGTGNEESITFYIDSVNIDINGQSAQLDIPNFLSGTEVWVSSVLVTDYMNNLSIQSNKSGSKLYISRIVDEEQSDEESEKYVYLPVSFKLKSSNTIDPISEEDVFGETE